MAKRDYYEVLGVGRDATQAEIKKAFRRLAMKHHPDRRPGDEAAEQTFKEAKEAYEVLNDAQKRPAYDRFGHAGVGSGSGGGAGFGPGSPFGNIFDEVFGDIFGGARRSARVFRGADLRYELTFTLEQAVAGDEVSIDIPTWVGCETCGGDGAVAGTVLVTCSTCGGSGQVRIQQGFFALQQNCPSCRGRGKVITDPCDDCHGHGRIRETRRLKVNVPPGVDTGDRIRLAGQGEAGRNGGPPGDLYVEIGVKPHAIFERAGVDLSCEIPIGFATVALGDNVDAPTLDGSVTIKVPAGTQSGKVFRLRGKGITPARGGLPGDLYCRVVVETPINLTQEQQELLRELESSLSEGGEKHSPRRRSWLDRAREFFGKF